MFEILNISDAHILIGCILDDEPILFSLAKMLNSSSPAQKNLSEEDSSGSEPETDRFGFILTNGSTAGWAHPPCALCTLTVLLVICSKPGDLSFHSPIKEIYLFFIIRD